MSDDIAICVQDGMLRLGNQIIFEDVHLQVHHGEICGLHGRNGSGKTMLLRCIAGLIPLTSGQIVVCNKIVKKESDFAPSSAFAFDEAAFLPQYSGRENLRFLASIRKAASEEDVDAMMIRVGLDPKNKKRVGKYSKGMIQRLNIAQAFMEKPRVVLLDEPMNALDETGMVMLRDLIREFTDKGGAIIISSHYKEDFDNLCTSIYPMGVKQPSKS